ncbi:MAG: peptidylprolyl isomerase [Gemmatimonadaceae bacterium]|nr:peptidylprolyl isomerase [Gemmatimonadaceae bacterium]
MTSARRAWLTRGILCGSLVLLAACASSGAGRNATSATGYSSEALRRDAALLRLVDQRRADTMLVDSLLLDPSPDRRARTALAIGQVRITARYPALRRMLLDGDTSIAANAAYALGIGRDTVGVLALARAVGGAPDPVAREAAWSLGEIGEPARPVIALALGEGVLRPRELSTAAQRAAPVRAALLLAAAKLRPAPVALVAPWLQDSAPEVVRAAAYVIARNRLPGGVRALLAQRAHPDEEVRQHVARALARTQVGDSLSAPAIEALRVLLTDPSERVRVNAVRSAATHGDALAEQVIARFADSAPNVRVAAAEGFADVAQRDVSRWTRAWAADTQLITRRTLLPQARRLGVDVFSGIEAEWAGHGDWRVRVAAMQGRERNAMRPEDSTLAQRLLQDSDVRVQRAARARLGIRDTTPRPPRSTAAVERPMADYEALAARYLRPGAPRPVAHIETEHGRITLELASREAPLVVEAFTRLAQNGTYRNSIFHRVVPNFVVQDGDVNGDGSGGSAGFTLRENWTRVRHERGCLGLATAGPDTGGSQYYLCHASQPHLDGAYTVFGRVIDGFEVMDRIVQGDLMLQVRVP